MIDKLIVVAKVSCILSMKVTLTVNCLFLASPLLLFHRHSYVPFSLAFPSSGKIDEISFSWTVPVYFLASFSDQSIKLVEENPWGKTVRKFQLNHLKPLNFYISM